VLPLTRDCWTVVDSAPLGSAAFSITYVLIGYMFGNQWKSLEAWLGAILLYVILAVMILSVSGVICRRAISRTFLRVIAKDSAQQGDTVMLSGESAPRASRQNLRFCGKRVRQTVPAAFSRQRMRELKATHDAIGESGADTHE
jgi:hypothetical protein